MNDNHNWLGGIFYFNSKDPSIFVERRMGIGFTLNWARLISWLLVFGIAALIICVIYFLNK